MDNISQSLNASKAQGQQYRPDKRHKTDKKRCLSKLLSGIDIEVDRYTTLANASAFNLDAGTEAGEPVDLLSDLTDWACDDTKPHFGLMLGEVGIGKTTACRMLTRRMSRAHRYDSTLPEPVYLDLRRVQDLAQDIIDVSTLIDTILKRTWQSSESNPPTAKDVIHAVRQQRAVIIFDGLDEVMNLIDENRGQQFTRELLQVLPTKYCRDDAHENLDANQNHTLANAGKVLLSCRSHFFRNFAEARGHIAGDQREQHTASTFYSWLVLPFNRQQIAHYLASALPQRDPEELLALFDSVHNLNDLASRPYTLNLIRQQISQLEQLRLRGEKINASMLYDGLVSEWLLRDKGKHQIGMEHKRQLMQSLASTLWNRKTRNLSAFALEDWLMDFLDQYPRIDRHYRDKQLDLLKEDLRNATFLVWGKDDTFRFAHTSLLEYFLAAHLLHSLDDLKKAIDTWSLKTPSVETFDFLAEQIIKDHHAPLERLLASKKPTVMRNLLVYANRASYLNAWVPSFNGVEVVDEVFADMHWRGNTSRHLDVSGIIFQNCTFRRCSFNSVKFESAQFKQSQFVQCEIFNSQLDSTQWHNCHINGSRIYRNSTENLITHNTISHGGFNDIWPPTTDRDIPTNQPEATENPRKLLLNGHTSRVNSCAFNHDGSRIVSASDDNTVRLWDATSGENLLVLNGHTSRVRSCAFNHDGSRIVSASDDNTVRLWDATSGENLLVLNGHSDWVISCAFNHDGSRIVSASLDNTVHLWDATSGENLLVLNGHTNGVTSCAFNHDGSRIVSASSGHTVRLWDATSGENLLVLNGHSDPVTSCAFNHDGSRIVSTSFDRTVRLWDTTSGENLLVLNGYSDPVISCAFNHDGSRIVSASDDHTVRLWDATSGENLLVLNGHSDPVNSCAFNHDGSRIVSASYDDTVRLWDATSGENLLVLNGHTSWVRSCAFNHDGSRIVSASDDNTVRLWDATSGENLLVLNGHTIFVNSCAFNHDGSWIVSASYDDTVRLWDATSGENLLVLNGHSHPVNSCAFNHDGSRIVSASDDHTVRLWDATGGENLLVLNGHSHPVNSCAFNHDGSRIVSASDDHTVRLWDATSGENLLVLNGHSDPVNSCAFDHDGSRIVSASDDHTVRLWDATSGENLLVLNGHTSWVRSCAFNHDGSRIVSASDDNTVRLWDATSGENLLVLNGHSDWVISCAFNHDGSRIVSASSDHTVRLWDATTGTCQSIYWHFQKSAYAVSNGNGDTLLNVGGEAWRYCSWQVTRADATTTMRPLVALMDQQQVEKLSFGEN